MNISIRQQNNIFQKNSEFILPEYNIICHAKAKERHRPGMFKNWVLRETFHSKPVEGTEKCSILNSGVLHDLLVLNSKCC